MDLLIEVGDGLRQRRDIRTGRDGAGGEYRGLFPKQRVGFGSADDFQSPRDSESPFPTSSSVGM